MKESKMDLMLHPIRMKIIQNLIGGRKLTAQQISEILPDIPQATMYRQLNKLLKSNVITVVEEKPVRGTVEKVYGIPESFWKESNEEILKATKEEHVKYFFTYLMSLMDDFEKYVCQESFDMEKDGVSYRRGKYYLTEEEYEELLGDLKTTFGKIVRNGPGKGRKARTLGFVMIPDRIEPGE